MNIIGQPITFNPNQLSTWKQAKTLAKRINNSGPFKGARIVVSNIFIPDWIGGPGDFQEPQDGDRYWLHYQFSNGITGINVGLVATEFGNYPNSPGYVFNWLLAQVAPK